MGGNVSLFKRNNKPSLGDQRAEEVSGKGLSGLLASNPLSSHFISPIKAPDEKRIYQYFVAIQVSKYGAAVDLDERITRHHISMALQEYAPVWIIQAVKFSSWISEHAFSIPFAIKALEEYEVKTGTNKHRRDQETSSVTKGSRILWS